MVLKRAQKNVDGLYREASGDFLLASSGEVKNESGALLARGGIKQLAGGRVRVCGDIYATDAHAVRERSWQLGLVPVSMEENRKGLSSTHHIRHAP